MCNGDAVTRRIKQEPPSSAGPASDEQVIRRVVSGDRGDFEILMRRYNQRLFRIIRAIVRNDAEAEDVMQDAYLAAYRNLAQFEGRARFSTWLTRIAINAASERVRSRRTRQWTDFESADAIQLDELSIHESAPDANLNARELREVLARSLDRLPPTLRAVFTLRDVEGLSTVETAECLGISASNAKVRLHRARLALGVLVDEELGDETRRLFQFAGQDCDRVVGRVMQAIRRPNAETGGLSHLQPPGQN